MPTASAYGYCSKTAVTAHCKNSTAKLNARSCWRRPTLPQQRSTIGAGGLNFRVRNGNGWTPSAKPPTANIQNENIVSKQNKSDLQHSRREIRPISTPRLRALPRFHLAPINQIISLGTMIPHLGVGFPLRCFQRLSVPNIATRQCHWRDSRQTRGSFIPVLSSCIPLFPGAQTISSPVLPKGQTRAVASYPRERSFSIT